jgi:drug/metabolite transporter (DMT)-like permease
MKINPALRHPIVLLTIGAILISFSSVWVKLANVPPSSSAFYRVFFGFFFLVFFSLRSKDHSNLRKRHFVLAALCGILFALDLLCWHNSIKLIGPGLATLLGNFQVFILAGAGILFFKEVCSLRLLFSVPLALTGLALVIGTDWSTTGAAYQNGVYYGIATALFYSAYLLTLRYLSGSSSGKYFPMMFISFISSIILGLYIFYSGESFAIPDLKSFFSLVCLGLFSQCLGWLLISASLPKTKASYAGLTLLLQPSLSFIWDVLFFARATSITNWLGVILTLVAIYLGMSASQKKL